MSSAHENAMSDQEAENYTQPYPPRQTPYLWDEDSQNYMFSENNYYKNNLLQYESFDEFLEEWGDADNDMNYVVNWRWTEYDNEPRLSILFILQRKGNYLATETKISRDDEFRVKEYLKSKWEYIEQVWGLINGKA